MNNNISLKKKLSVPQIQTMAQITFVLLLLFCETLTAQQLTIDSIKVEIAKNNHDLLMYNSQIKAYTSYAEGAKSWESPLLGAGLYMIPYKFDKNMGSLMFSVQQMIPNPTKLKANEKYMLSMSEVESESKNVKYNLLVSQAKTVYYEWLILKKKQTVLSESEQLMNYIIQTSEIRYTYQKEKLNRIYKAKSELASLKSMEVEIQNQIEQKQIVLNTLMNRNKTMVFDIDTNFVIKDYEKNAMDTSKIKDFRSDLKVIDQTIKVAQLKQEVEKSKAKPDFGIRIDHANGFGTQPNQFSLMAMFTLPIVPWSSKMYKSNVKGLEYEIEALQHRKQATSNEVAGMISGLQTDIKNKKAQVKLYQENIIPALQRNYKTTLLAYEQNTEELFMVLDAWQTLKMAQLEYYNQVQEFLLKQVEYEKELEFH